MKYKFACLEIYMNEMFKNAKYGLGMGTKKEKNKGTPIY